MTEYIKNQLIKLCDHPEWFNDMLTIWDNNPEEPHTAIRNYLSHVQLNGLLENTKIHSMGMNLNRDSISKYPKILMCISYLESWMKMNSHIPYY
jgi:hypothetical protein